MRTFEGIDPRTATPIRVSVERGVLAAVERPAAVLGLPAAPALPTAPTAPVTPSSPQSFLCPGFIDLQLNGFAGIDYSAPGLDAAAIERLIRAVAASGTTRHLATIITGPRERIVESCRAVCAAARASALVRTAVAGIHVEGPFLSAEDGPRGAHDRAHVRDPDYREFREWQDAAGGMIRIVTIAPEREGAIGFIERVSRDGVVVAIGHTAASPETIRAAVDAGARLSTHLGNGSHALLPRLRNYLWEQLADDRLCASIIADGFHLPDAVLRVAARAKGLQRLVLVSDAAFLAGSSPGIARWGDTAVEVHADGHLSVAGTEFLAGAGHLLDRCVARFVAATGTPVREAIALCTEAPARLLGLPASVLDFVDGEPACLTRFRHVPGADRLAIEDCVIAGEDVLDEAREHS
jgi:N-acetylglucosamine-6-phosphate deacetylase